MAKVRKALKTPLATNMCTTSFEDIPQSIQLGAEDIILSDHHFWGGLQASMNLASICQTFGRDLSMHSNSHLGISLAAMVHLGAAIPNLKYALDTHYPWQSDEIIVGGRMKFENGSVEVPNGPEQVFEQPAREGQLQYVFQTGDLDGIVKDHPYKAVLRIIDGATGAEIARYHKTFKTAVDQSTLPPDPLVVGPAYQQP